MLHNFRRTEMSFDDMELEMNYEPPLNLDFNSVVIDTKEPSNESAIQRQIWPKTYGAHGKQVKLHEEFVYELMQFSLFNIGFYIAVAFYLVFNIVLLFSNWYCIVIWM